MTRPGLAFRLTGLVCLLLFAAGCGGSDDKIVAEPRDSPPVKEPATEKTVEAVPAPDSPDETTVDVTTTTDTTSTQASPQLLLISPDARRSFSRVAAQHPGKLGVALTPVGWGAEPETIGSFQTGVAWSTAKVPLAIAVLQDAPSATDRADVKSALTVSDNAAALRLWQRLGGGDTAASATQNVLRQAGDTQTVVEPKVLRSGFTPFGQTQWSLANQARFMASIDCVPQGGEVLKTMRDVSPAQRWGLGSIGASPAFKGGWGPGVSPGVGSGYLDRQMGVVTLNGQRVAVAIAALPSAGSHQAGIAALDAVSSWVEQEIKPPGGVSAASC
jgi:hypothetical protein